VQFARSLAPAVRAHHYPKEATVNRKIIAISLLIFFIHTKQLFSQGAYLERGKSGFEISAGYCNNKSCSGIIAGASYSVLSIFDFGFSVGHLFNKQLLEGFKVTVTGVSPFLTIHPIKQDNTIPISISISGSYEFDSYSSQSLRNHDLSMGGSYFSFGGSVYRNITLLTASKLQPSIGVAYLTGKLETKTLSEQSIYLSDIDMVVYEVGLSLIFQSDPLNIMRISPAVLFDKKQTTYAISVGFIFEIGE